MRRWWNYLKILSNMKLGKIIDGAIDLVEVENGKEVTKSRRKRTEESLYNNGYKKACPSPDGTGIWREYPSCLVQEPESEIKEE